MLHNPDSNKLIFNVYAMNVKIAPVIISSKGYLKGIGELQYPHFLSVLK